MDANLVAIQLVSVPEPERNLAQVRDIIDGLKVTAPTLVVLPECFASFGGDEGANLAIAEPLGNGPIQDALAKLAAEYGVWLVSGTIPTRNATDPQRFSASCVIFDDCGNIRADYQKIHLFDAQVGDNTGSYLESKHTQPGKKITVLPDTPFGRMGVAVCYDLRFPGLFQAMGEVDTLVLPAAFTQKTGAAHWHTLLKARSIEKQCYTVAANQGGQHQNGRSTYGHSCIYSGWGQLLGEIPHGVGCVAAPLELQQLARLRAKMPISNHNRFRSELV